MALNEIKRKVKKILTSFRVVLLLVFLLFALVAIYPNPWSKGAAIRSIEPDSSAFLAGIKNPARGSMPMSKEVILSISNKPVKDVADYHSLTENLRVNQSIQLKTNRGIYKLTVKEKTEEIVLNETVEKIITEIIQANETVDNKTVLVNKTISKTVLVNKTKTISLGAEDIGIDVFPAPKTNIRKGLDLEGGVRILLQPEETLSKADLDSLQDSMEQRLNVYGLSDIVIRQAAGLPPPLGKGEQYILVEIPGGNEKDVRSLKEQGKFEAKIGNETVFIGGKKDITYICRSADCAGIDPSFGCSSSNGQSFCRFRFSITLSQDAAKKQAELTSNLEVIRQDKDEYLSEKLILFLDDKQVDELSIGADLKGKAVTDIQISGSGIGATEQEAALDALKNMKKLQTILITGSLPVKLDIVKIDTISPILGEEFIKNAIFIGVLSILVVALVLLIRYRKIQTMIPMMVILLSEVVILLGFAALINWNLDIASIAGIIIMIGTGVNDQTIITDETLKGETKTAVFNWKERIKRAFFIIVGAYLTVVFAMIPLIFAGAGLLKGFALTTIIGLSIGIVITRPAYAVIIEILLKD